MQIKIKKLKAAAIIPSYSHAGDAGLDLYSLEDHSLEPGQRHSFKLGFSMELPEDFVALFWDKSGLAAKHGLQCLGGVIDSGYRGEYTVVLANTSSEAYQIKKGDKIAQMLIQPIETAELTEVDELPPSSRQDGAWGSTGK